MSGRVFTKLMFSFVVVLCMGTAVLDFSLRRIVDHSLHSEAAKALEGKARLLSEEAHVKDPASLAALATRGAADSGSQVTFFSKDGRELASSALLDDQVAEDLVPPEVRVVLSRRASAGVAERDGRLYVAVAGDDLIVRLAYSLESIQATMRMLRRALLVASLLALVLAMLTAAMLARRVALRLKRIVTFANRIASGELSARVEEGNLDEISEVAHALDATASRLEHSFHALESSQRELAALLNSMQEAVLAVDAQGQVSWSNAVMQRVGPVRNGRSLVHSIRDPEVLFCVEGALRDR